MRTTLVGYTLSLAPEWHAVPHRLADGDVAAWALGEAERLVAAAEPADPPILRLDLGAPTAPRDDSGGDSDPVLTLAAAIAAVADAAAATPLPGLETAFLVRHPGLARVDAVAYLVMRQGVSAESFFAELEKDVARDLDNDGAFEILGDVPAGTVRGAHLLTSETDERVAGARHVQESAAVGLFPSGCAHMIDVVVMVNGAGTVPDLPQVVVDLLAGIEVETEAAE